MASPDVIKSVSRKLKYYLEIQRLEDGFDLSGPDCPRMDHPPIRARSALQYSGLHDRPLKHYFHRPSVRVALTNFKATDDKNSEQEDEIRKSITKNMKKYQFNSPSLADDYYSHDSRAGIRLRPEIGWRGTQLVRGKMPYVSGRRVLRSAPPDSISRKETKRLLDSTCHLVLAAESGLRSETESSEDENEKKETGNKMKQNERKNKVNQKKGKDTESPPPPHGQRALNNNAGQKKESTTMTTLVKRNHEKKDMQQQQKQRNSDSDEREQRQLRRSSPESRNKQHKAAATHNDPAGQHHHKTMESHSKQTQKTSTKEQHKTNSSDEKFLGRVSVQPAHTKSAKCKSPTRDDNNEMRSSLRNPRNKRLTRSYDQFYRTLTIGTQTSAELLKDYDPSEQVLTEGAEIKYHVDVQTGKCAGAGTKAEIQVVLIGDLGRTEYLPLSDALTPHKIKFKRNQHDLFEVLCPSIGNLQQIKIGHNKKQAEYKWYVESVTVRDFARHVEYRIPCQKWLSGAFGDRETFGEFKVKSSSTFSVDDVDAMDFDPEETYVAMVRTERRASVESENPNVVNEDRVKNSGSLSVENSQTTEMKNGEEGTNDDDSNLSSVISEGELRIAVSPTTTPKSPEKSEQPRADRNDDFFDKTVRETDYSSIIESIISRQSDSENNSMVPHFASSGTRLSQIEARDRERTLESYSQRSTAYLEPRSAPAHQKGTSAKVHSPPYGQKHQSSTLNQSMQDAVRFSRYNDLQRLTEDHPELLEQMIDGEYTPIHVATSNNQLEILKWLTSHVTDIDVESKGGHTAFQLAAINGYMDCLKVLFDMGAKINYRNSSGLTALHLATMAGNVNSVKWLLENGANKTVQDNSGSTPLDRAKEFNHNEIVKIISSFATSSKRGASKKEMRKVDKTLML